MDQKQKAMDRGHNATRIRVQNARTVLDLVHREKEITRAELARLTGLSPPAISSIVSKLEADGYVEKKSRRLGGVGTPSTLFGIRRGIAFSVGIHIGRRSTVALLLDMTGEVFAEVRRQYQVPKVDEVTQFTNAALEDWHATVPEFSRRLVGLGICSPKFFDYSAEDLGYPETIAAEWDLFKPEVAFDWLVSKPVFEENDANAAALAELEWGNGRSIRNFLYVYIGTFIGAGLVLDGRLVRGPQGLAATFGPFPVAPSQLRSAGRAGGDFDYLFRRASLFVLRDHLRHGGFKVDEEDALEAPEPAWAPLIEEWADDAALALAQAIQGAVAIIDVEAVVIEAPLPRPVLGRLIDQVRAVLARAARKMIVKPQILPALAGRQPSVRGAAMVPFSEVLGIGKSNQLP